MTSVCGRDRAKTVERKGWVLLRVPGSHHIYGQEGSIVHLSIPVHEGRDLKIGC